MVKRKYTLPRHTNIAPQGKRIGAFLVDLAICLAFTLVLLYGVFQWIFAIPVNPIAKELENEQVNTHLRYRDENGNITQLSSSASFEEFRGTISYFYLNYLTGNVDTPGTGSRTADVKIKLDNGQEVSKKDYYTVSWFNKTIFGMGEDPDNESKCLFTYVKVDGVYDKNQLGIPKDTSIVPAQDVNTYMQQKFVNAFNDFNNLDYVLVMTNKINFLYTLESVVCFVIGASLTYIMFPVIFKNGQTVGKKVYGLGLANSEGYKVSNKQLPMRLMPSLVVSLALLVPIWTDFFYILLVILTVFLVSFAVSMASPKRTSLHDFTARTIVIDLKGSIIFDNEAEEEAYIIKEDNIEIPESSGEEPELKYEK